MSDELDLEVAELCRAERSKIDDQMAASARKLPPIAPAVKLRPLGWTAAVLAAITKFIGKPGPKRRPGPGREKAIRNDFERRSK